jgi:hypothetical protein
MYPAISDLTRPSRSRKQASGLSAEMRALIDEAAVLDADKEFQARRNREDAIRKQLKDKLGYGYHRGNRFDLEISAGTPQRRLDTEAIKVEMGQVFVAKYTKESQVRNMDFIPR